MIDVLLLGTGAMVPLPGRYLSATLFRINAHLHLIDCGEGTQVAMRQFHWGFKRLDTILLTHFHADHIAGLPGLMHTVAHSGKTDPLHILGPVGTYEVISGLFVIARDLPFDVFIHEMEQGSTVDLPSGARVTAAEGKHRGTVLAFRIDLERKPAFLPDHAERLGVPRKLWSRLQRGEDVVVDNRTIEPKQVMSGSRPGASLGIATDTRPVESVRTLMHNVDLLIAEGTYGSDEDAAKALQRGHMTFREAATLARDAHADSLWLTHFGAGLGNPQEFIANATNVFPGAVLGESGLEGSIAFDSGFASLGVRRASGED